ncbi:hypothetical protein D3C72_1969100 [compost metagenome]
MASGGCHGGLAAVHGGLYACPGTLCQPTVAGLPRCGSAVCDLRAVLHVVVLQRGEGTLCRGFARSSQTQHFKILLRYLSQSPTAGVVHRQSLHAGGV